MNELRETYVKKAIDISALPENPEYVFEAEFDLEKYPVENLSIQKTKLRTVVSLKYSAFQAKEIIREETQNEKHSTLRSAQLASIVPSSAKYAYDLIAYVGKKCYLEGYKLDSINAEIAGLQGGSHIPRSSLYDLQRKFLFYFGEVHRKAIPEIKTYLRERGDITWLIDGTIEPGSPVFFGIKDAYDGIFLQGWKIPTENEESISKCLLEGADHYGKPDEILHDLSQRMMNSCEKAFPDRPHRVCQYHLCSDMGKDLYDVPQKILNKRLRSLKLQPYLKNQRSSQTQKLKCDINDKNVQLILKDVLNGTLTNFEFSDVLAREILLGLHSWMLDYASDGHRQGYPFDPYLLYFHRRIARIHDVTKNIIERGNHKNGLPRIFYSFSEKIETYLKDTVIEDAIILYEKAFQIFTQIREVLRLNAKSANPMRDIYELNDKGKRDVCVSLNDLIEEFENRKRNCSDIEELNLYKIVLSHTKKYEPYLFQNNAGVSGNGKFIRTTNGIESYWGSGKRLRRQTHGRMKLTNDFCVLPAEYMLIPNLNNPLYVELVLGNIESLPEKIAEAGKTAGSYSAWCKSKKLEHTGRLPKKMIRNENFIDDLTKIFEL